MFANLPKVYETVPILRAGANDFFSAATAAAFLTSVSTTSQRRDLAPIYRPRYVGPRYFTLVSIPFFVYYYNRIQSVPLVKEIQQTKDYIIDTMANSHTWFDKITARVRGDRAIVESLEKPHHDEDEDIDFLKEVSQIKKQELRTTSAQRRAGGSVEDDE